MFRRTVLALSALALIAIPTTVAAAGTGSLPIPAQYSTTAKATGKTTAPTKKPTPTPSKTTKKPTPTPTKTTAKPTPTPTKTTKKPTPTPTKTTAKPTPTPTKTTAKPTPTPTKTTAKPTPTPTKTKPTPPPVKCYHKPYKHKHPRPCYPPKSVSVTISRANPVVGQKSLILVTHAAPKALARIRVITAGTAKPDIRVAGVWESAAKTVGTDGTVEFPVVLNAPGEFEIDVLVDDAVVSEQKVTAFTDEAAVVPAATIAGLDPLQLGLFGGAGVLVIAGAAVILIRRRGGAHAI